jgi:hypothetical protein
MHRASLARVAALNGLSERAFRMVDDSANEISGRPPIIATMSSTRSCAPAPNDDCNLAYSNASIKASIRPLTERQSAECARRCYLPFVETQCTLNKK